MLPLFDGYPWSWRVRSSRAAAVVAVALLYVSAGPANAREGDAPDADEIQPCIVQRSEAVRLSADSPGALIAICGAQAVVLGEADEFEAVTNRDLGAVLVDVKRNGSRKILLVSPQAGDSPLVEDIGGQVAMAAGKGPVSPIDDVTVDVAGFAGDGTIAVANADDAGRINPIELARQVVSARAAMSARVEN